jgi:hypothetical protein
MTPLDLLSAGLLVGLALFLVALDAAHRRRERRRPNLVMQAWRLGLRTDRDEPLHKLESRIRNAKGRTE